MAEYACRSCGKQVSVETESCPNCGTPYPAEGEKTARKLTMQAVGSAAKSEPVHITNIDIPFWSMVVFMVKWAIASIPALPSRGSGGFRRRQRQRTGAIMTEEEAIYRFAAAWNTHEAEDD